VGNRVRPTRAKHIYAPAIIFADSDTGPQESRLPVTIDSGQEQTRQYSCGQSPELLIGSFRARSLCCENGCQDIRPSP
jgi:hypothetical protein